MPNLGQKQPLDRLDETLTDAFFNPNTLVLKSPGKPDPVQEIMALRNEMARLLVDTTYKQAEIQRTITELEGRVQVEELLARLEELRQARQQQKGRDDEMEKEIVQVLLSELRERDKRLDALVEEVRQMREKEREEALIGALEELRQQVAQLRSRELAARGDEEERRSWVEQLRETLQAVQELESLVGPRLVPRRGERDGTSYEQELKRMSMELQMLELRHKIEMEAEERRHQREKELREMEIYGQRTKGLIDFLNEKLGPQIDNLLANVVRGNEQPLAAPPPPPPMPAQPHAQPHVHHAPPAQRFQSPPSPPPPHVQVAPCITCSQPLVIAKGQKLVACPACYTVMEVADDGVGPDSQSAPEPLEQGEPEGAHP